MIVVECDGREATWDPDSGFRGDPQIVEKARSAAEWGYEVEWGRLPPQTASGYDPAGALTALMGYNPGRTRILEWPDWLRDWWQTNTISCSGHEY